MTSSFEKKSPFYIISNELGLIQKRTKNIKEVDDISGLNKTQIRGVYQITSVSEVVDIIDIANKTKSKISFLGAGHCMGGHTFFPDGIQIDTKKFNQIIDLNLKERTVTVQPGIMWTSLIQFLNKEGFSPSNLQSYSGFTVGGSVLGTNGHGVVSDFSIAHSVKSMKVLLPDKRRIQVNSTDELFGYLVGSFGTIGFAYEIVLHIVQNDKLKLVATKYNTYEGFKRILPTITEHIEKTWKESLTKSRCHFMRFNMENLDTFTFYEYDRHDKVKSDLSINPPVFSWIASIIFHWFAHLLTFQYLRKYYEYFTGKHGDSVYSNSKNEKYVDRNSFIFENQEGVSGKLTYINATHVLQEYFVPYDTNVHQFVLKIKEEFIRSDPEKIKLLNLTGRLIKKDELNIALSYSNKHPLVIGFVLYIRVGIDDATIENLKQIHMRLNNEAIKLDGTFYLPYLHHYNKEQIILAYPNIEKFICVKKCIDPDCIFTNKWFQNILQLIDPNNEIQKVNGIIGTIYEVTSLENETIYKDNGEPDSNTFEQLLKVQHLKTAFEMFFNYIFTLPNDTTIRYILNNCENMSDEEIYRNHLLPAFNNNIKFSPINNIKFVCRAYKAKQTQSIEIERQLRKLFEFNQIDLKNIKTISNLGDFGAYMRLYQKLFSQNIDQTFFMVGFTNANKWKAYFNGLIEEKITSTKKRQIVFCLGGLHHYSEQELQIVLHHLEKIVEDGGYFVLRDHDVSSPHDKLMVNAAHTAFNALTGETYATEIAEKRLFRSKKEWVTIMNNIGFDIIYTIDGVQVMFSEVQQYDPTKNILMCFKKRTTQLKSNSSSNIKNVRNKSDFNSKMKNVPEIRSATQIPEWFNVLYAQKYGQLLVDLPWFKFPFLKCFYQMLSLCWFVFRKEKGLFDSDLFMSFFVVFFHSLSCLFGALAGYIIGLTFDPNSIGGTRIIKVIDSNKTNNKDEECYKEIEVPMYRPFTTNLLEWFEQDAKFTVVEISGNKYVWTHLEGPKPSDLKWPTISLEDLVEPNQYQSYVKVNVKELRELWTYTQNNGIKIVHIFQQ
jgi:FAD/FMN-containing dehydrogenase